VKKESMSSVSKSRKK